MSIYSKILSSWPKAAWTKAAWTKAAWTKAAWTKAADDFEVKSIAACLDPHRWELESPVGKIPDCAGTASGIFTNCVGGYSSFGGGTASGTFVGYVVSWRGELESPVGKIPEYDIFYWITEGHADIKW